MTERVIVPFPVTLDDLARLTRAAQMAGHAEQARALLAQLSDRRLRQRYAELAQQNPDGEGW